MKTFVCIHNGPEQRDYMVERTINLCKDYVDDVVVVQNGISVMPSETILKHTKYSTNSFISFPDMFNITKSLVDKDSWFLQLDSDETPNIELLRFMKNETNKLDEYNMSLMYFNAHFIDENGYSFRGDVEFAVNRLYQNVDSLRAAVAQKVHCGFINDNPLVFVDKSLRILHFKHKFAILLSTLSHMIYSIDKSDVGFDNITDEEILTLDKIKSFFGNYTPDMTYKEFDNKELWKDIRSVSQSLCDSSTHYLREMYTAMSFIIHCKDKLIDMYKIPECNYKCCNYGQSNNNISV